MNPQLRYIALAFAIVFAVVAAALGFGWIKDATAGNDAVGCIGLSLGFGWLAHF